MIQQGFEHEIRHGSSANRRGYNITESWRERREFDRIEPDVRNRRYMPYERQPRIQPTTYNNRFNVANRGNYRGKKGPFISLRNNQRFLGPTPIANRIFGGDISDDEFQTRAPRRAPIQHFDKNKKKIVIKNRIMVKPHVHITRNVETQRNQKESADPKHSTVPLHFHVKQMSHVNDYCQHFVDTGQRPQNFIQGADYNTRFKHHPGSRRLLELKDKIVKEQATPAMWLQCDLKTYDLTKLGTLFDVVLIDPPWEEYHQRDPKLKGQFWTLEQMQKLPVGKITGSPSFLFLWCGTLKGLEEGRALMSHWGFRRCEDITWVKTNKISNEKVHPDKRTVLQPTVEHCLLGIKGMVRRKTDFHIIHCNIDTDVIVAEEPPAGSTMKPEELYHVIEHFCLGRRRLELFGEDHNIRKGWLTLGESLSSSNFNAVSYAANFEGEKGHLLEVPAEIETLRPKSPEPPAKSAQISAIQ